MDKEKDEEVHGIGYAALFFIAVGILAYALCGCKQTEYVEVPVETVKEVQVQVDKWRTDTLRDSIFNQVYVKEYLKGDTVYRDSIDVRYTWKTKVNTVYRDSVCLKTDTVSVPYPVEKQLTKWQQTAVDWFGTLVKIALAMAALIIIFVVYKIKKLIKK